MSRYRTDEQGILRRMDEELRHLLYHSQRDGMGRAEHDAIIQKMINDLQSLIGYGTAAEPSTSGEEHAFEYAMNRTDKPHPVVFDVGAHVGNYFAEVILPVIKRSERRPEIHCFEPHPESCDALAEYIAAASSDLVIHENLPKVRVRQLAISADGGLKELYSHVPGAAQSTLVPPDFSYLGVEFSHSVQVRTETVASYCSKVNIDVVDFLKLDVEGHEFEIVSSCLDMIRNRKIRFLQFEFGIANVDRRVFFKDFWKALSPLCNFYRVHPEGLIPIPDYKQELEVFHVANYLLELKNG